MRFCIANTGNNSPRGLNQRFPQGAFFAYIRTSVRIAQMVMVIIGMVMIMTRIRVGQGRVRIIMTIAITVTIETNKVRIKGKGRRDKRGNVILA